MTKAVFSTCCEMLLLNSDGPCSCARLRDFLVNFLCTKHAAFQALEMHLDMSFKASDVFLQKVCNGGHKMEKRVR